MGLDENAAIFGFFQRVRVIIMNSQFSILNSIPPQLRNDIAMERNRNVLIIRLLIPHNLEMT